MWVVWDCVCAWGENRGKNHTKVPLRPYQKYGMDSGLYIGNVCVCVCCPWGIQVGLLFGIQGRGRPPSGEK
jgi:hypothetical protein